MINMVNVSLVISKKNITERFSEMVSQTTSLNVRG